jgi:hypothetical protein
MQKVEGSNPFSRFVGKPRSGGVFYVGGPVGQTDVGSQDSAQKAMLLSLTRFAGPR